MFTPIFVRSGTSRLLVRRHYHEKCIPDFTAGQMQKQSYYQYRGLCEIKAIRPFPEPETALAIYVFANTTHNYCRY